MEELSSVTEVTNEVSAPAPDTVEQAAPEIQTEPAPLADRIDADLRQVWDKHNPPRDPVTKRFTARDQGQAQETTADQTAEVTTEQAQEPAIEPPLSWSAEAKAKWEALPPDLKQYVAQRDKETHEAITRAGQQIKAFEPISSVVEQFAETFQRNGLPPHEGIARMLAVEQWLGKDPAGAISEIARAYGVDLRSLTGGHPAEQGEPAEGTGQPSTLVAEVARLTAELGQVKSHLTARERQAHEAAQGELARQIADFAKDKPHFETVRRHMAALMQTGAANDLAQAYEQATFAVPEIRNRILEDQRKAEQEKRDEEAKKKATDARKSASVNVKSSPGTGTVNKTMDDTLRETAARLFA